MSTPQKKAARKMERAYRRQEKAVVKYEREQAEEAELRTWGVVGRIIPGAPGTAYNKAFRGWADVFVTEEDAAQGMARNPLFDALCIALSRHGYRGVRTSGFTLAVEGCTLMLPDPLVELVQSLDDGKVDLLPFIFRLPVLPGEQGAGQPVPRTHARTTATANSWANPWVHLGEILGVAGGESPAQVDARVRKEIAELAAAPITPPGGLPPGGFQYVTGHRVDMQTLLAASAATAQGWTVRLYPDGPPPSAADESD